MTSLRRVALLVLLCAATAAGETRVETYSEDGLPDKLAPALIEVDVAKKVALGIRETGLGTRGTNEFYFRLNRSQETAALDPRDKRKEGMKNPLKALGSIHVGVVGLELDGTRGMPLALRAGLYGLTRLPQSTVLGVTELAYQTGTFGGDPLNHQNQGGLYTRWGMRKAFKSGWYTEGDYTLEPGGDKDWLPRIRFGMTF